MSSSDSSAKGVCSSYQLTVTNSTLSNPEGAPDGLVNDGTLIIVNSTVDDMMQNHGILTVKQSTVDRVDSQIEDSVTIANSLIARCVERLLCGVRSPRHAKTCLVVGAVQQSLSKGESLTSESAVPRGGLVDLVD